MVAVFGLRKFRRNTFGPFYYFSSYNAAIRYSAWTRDYKPFQISGKNLTNSEGRWKSSGIIRFVLFLGKTKVMLNHPDDVKNKIAQVSIYKNILDPASNWSNRYDSVYVGRAKLQNGFVVRSIHNLLFDDSINNTHLLFILLILKPFKGRGNPLI